MISFVSSPLFVTATIMAFLWSIHRPTVVFIDSSFVYSLHLASNWRTQVDGSLSLSLGFSVQ
jgi:hypothetical protein